MERDLPNEIRSLFEQALRGDFSFLELLIIPRSTDGYLELFYYLKEVQRLGFGANLPPLYLYDIQHSETPRAYAYGLERTRELKRRLEVISGLEITDQRLRAAIEMTNRRRGEIQQLLDLRRTVHVTGSEALEVVGAAFFMEPGEYATALQAYMRHKQPKGAASRGLLVMSSVPLYHTDLHTAVEEAGGHVIAEDDWWGARSIVRRDIDTAGDLLSNVFDRYFYDFQSPRVFPPELREEWFRSELARNDVEAVLFYIPPGDLWLGWDYPHLLKETEMAAKPSLLLREDASTASGRRTTVSTVRTFVEGLT
jgi:benzoyl-CoA reductase/2-hydroxyglutaryl-CoA dehydratase subunit BcrC/BadD/HgdB